MRMEFSNAEETVMLLACETFKAMQGIPTHTSKYERLAKRWEEEKAAVLWMVLGRLLEEPQQ